jgi:hypothetical protein
MSTLAMRLTSSPPRCCEVPGLDDAKLYLPGLCLSSPRSSWKVFAGIVGCTTNTYGVVAISAAGARSLSLYGSDE